MKAKDASVDQHQGQYVSRVPSFGVATHRARRRRTERDWSCARPTIQDIGDSFRRHRLSPLSAHSQTEEKDRRKQKAAEVSARAKRDPGPSPHLRLARVDELEASVDGVAREVAHQVAVPAPPSHRRPISASSPREADAGVV